MSERVERCDRVAIAEIVFSCKGRGNWSLLVLVGGCAHIIASGTKTEMQKQMTAYRKAFRNESPLFWSLPRQIADTLNTALSRSTQSAPV